MLIRFKLIGLLIGLQFLSACRDPGIRAPIRIANKGESHNKAILEANDENKIKFSKNLFDPLQIPAVRKYVQPILQKISTNEKGELQNLMRLKNWYRVPLELNKIPVVPLSFSKSVDKSHEIAMQTGNDVWIDERAFSKLTEFEQAQLILQQTVMIIYLQRFSSFSDLCVKYERIGIVKRCSKSIANKTDLKKINEDFPSLIKRELNPRDYQLVEAATKWLLENVETLTKENFEAYSKKIGLSDSRFDHGFNLVEKEKHISMKQFENMIHATVFGKTIPEVCVSQDRDQKFKCQTELSIGDTNERQENVKEIFKKLRLAVSDLESQQTLVSHEVQISPDGVNLIYSPFGYYFMSQTSSLNQIDSPPGEKGYRFLLFADRNLDKFQSIEIAPLVKVGQETIDQRGLNNGSNMNKSCTQIKFIKSPPNETHMGHILITQDEDMRNINSMTQIEKAILLDCK